MRSRKDAWGAAVSEERFKQVSEAAMVGAVARHLLTFLGALANPKEVAAVNQILVAWLEDNGAGSPEPDNYFSALREDAAFWADIATPIELEAYTSAGLRRIERTHFAEATTKRLFVLFWECMSDDDKRKFLARVDGQGRFMRCAS